MQDNSRARTVGQELEASLRTRTTAASAPTAQAACLTSLMTRASPQFLVNPDLPTNTSPTSRHVSGKTDAASKNRTSQPASRSVSPAASG